MGAADVHYFDLFTVFTHELANFVGQPKCGLVVAIVYVQSPSPVGKQRRFVARAASPPNFIWNTELSHTKNI
jgi:hypothetical protein